jgi:hypothetical protein
VGRAVFEPGGERIGQLIDLYADTGTGAIPFAGVAMIRRGRRRLVFVSLTDASIGPASVTVKCGKELARRAPRAAGPTRRDATRGRRNGTVCSLRHSVPVPRDEGTPARAMPLTEARTCTAFEDAA